MTTRIRISLVLLLLTSVLRLAARVDAQPLAADFGRNLVYTPITPCRIVDTRVHGDDVQAGESRTFRSNPRGSHFFSQGGSSTTCGLGGWVPTAMVITVTALAREQAGYAIVHASGIDRPLAASLTFRPGVAVSNSVIVQLSAIESPIGFDAFEVYSSARADYVIDLVGFFAPAELKPLPCFQGLSETVTIAPRSEGTVTATCDVPWRQIPLTRTMVACSQLEPAPRTLALTETGFNCSAFNFGSESRTLTAVAHCCFTLGSPSPWLLDPEPAAGRGR